MSMSFTPRQLLAGWVELLQPTWCPETTFGRTLKKKLKCNHHPSDIAAWSALFRGRPKFQLLAHSIPTLSPLTAFVVNSEPHTGARPSVRACVRDQSWLAVFKNLTSLELFEIAVQGMRQGYL
jgi:hypothetical protein